MTKTLRQYVIDAFTDEVFRGNPAAVCLLDEWLDEALMQAITSENRYSETAFAVRSGDGWQLRWFTPGGEIALCGHATLATGYAVMRFVDPGASQVNFATKSGILSVARRDGLYWVELPAIEMRAVPVSDAMEAALGARPREAWLGDDLVCVFDDEATVRAMAPKLDLVAGLDGLLVHATAPGKDDDYVVRSFAPKFGVDEDPVCGRGHCHLAPLWSGKLGRDELSTWQASARGGALRCRTVGDRVSLGGSVALYAIADLFPDAD